MQWLTIDHSSSSAVYQQMANRKEKEISNTAIVR